LASSNYELKSGSRIAHFVMLNEEVSLSWIQDHRDGLQDTSGTNTEITTIPFVGDELPRPDATTGACKSG
jgi:hypothetical protein